jgi:diguanylate cyclase (GGDEF)-like protein
MGPVIEYAKRWVSDQLSLGEFSSRRSVKRRALIMAIRIAIFAYGLNVCAHFALYWCDLLPYGLAPALVIATILTPAVSLPVAFFAYYVVGMAVYELSLSHREFERISRTDALSGLLNRRAFMDNFARMQNPSAMILFDIDRFKSINDTHGHADGDRVIVSVAEELTRMFVGGHVVARFGGEEFAVLLIGLTADECLQGAESARALIASRPFELSSGVRTITVSAGIADCRDHDDFTSLFSAADKALYLAKASGRNRVMHARDLAVLTPPTTTDDRLAG